MPHSATPGDDAHKRRCSQCGSHVSLSFARVFGSNHDSVHACPSCSTLRELQDEVPADPSAPSTGH